MLQSTYFFVDSRYAVNLPPPAPLWLRKSSFGSSFGHRLWAYSSKIFKNFSCVFDQGENSCLMDYWTNLCFALTFINSRLKCCFYELHLVWVMPQHPLVNLQANIIIYHSTLFWNLILPSQPDPRTWMPQLINIKNLLHPTSGNLPLKILKVWRDSFMEFLHECLALNVPDWYSASHWPTWMILTLLIAEGFGWRSCWGIKERLRLISSYIFTRPYRPYTKGEKLKGWLMTRPQ